MPSLHKPKKTEGKGSLHRRGEGLGTGKVGNSGRGDKEDKKVKDSKKEDRGLLELLTGTDSSTSQQQQQQQPQQPQPVQQPKPQNLTGGSASGSTGKGLNLKSIIIIAVIVILILLFTGKLKGCGCDGLLSGGDSGNNSGYLDPGSNSSLLSGLFGGSALTGSELTQTTSDFGLGSLLSGSGFGSTGLTGAATSSGSWIGGKNTGKLDETVAAGSRKKYTKLLGKGRDVVNIMVYMCGTDLESQYGMATSDLQEMLNATFSDNINLYVYTGGCSKWKNNVISNQTNQIYQIQGGQLIPRSKNEGSKAMTNPSTLSGFIQFCDNDNPANRNILIFWDHGGGSVTGYGYDEKYKSSGSMTLSGIKTALDNGGVTFDFIGFDACLMATAETAMLLGDYADYMVGSEESEPGVGWYYTNWLTKLAENPSMSTLEIGKNICDDFVSACAQQAAGQSTTLSLIDLAEFANTVPSKLTAFSKKTTTLISSDYSTVSKARGASREFAASSKIDQVDLVHFAKNVGTAEGDALAEALLSSIKYNRVSNDMTNSYGLSVYFPYRSKSYVDKAISTYKQIGMDTAFSKCIQNFASAGTAGQASSGGTVNYSSSVFDLLGGGQSQSTTSGDISGLLGSFLGAPSTSSSSLSALSSLFGGRMAGESKFLEDTDLDAGEMAAYIEKNLLDQTKLNWVQEGEDTFYLPLEKKDWANVTGVAMSVYYSDGEGYIDLGIDNIFALNKQGYLLAPEKMVWLTVNGQFVPYYFESYSEDDGYACYRGYIPALLNAELDGKGNWKQGTGTLVKLQVLFDKENPNGRIIGATSDYERDDEISVLAKNLITLERDDTIDFVADYYTEEGVYEDTYMVGERMIYNGEWKLGMKEIEKDCANVMYRFTDLYGKYHWSQSIYY